MPDPIDHDAWIANLTVEQVRNQLQKRGLAIDGSITVARNRLIRYERELRERGEVMADEPALPIAEESARGGETPRPTAEVNRGAIPRTMYTDSTRSRRSSTVMDVCNLMRRWNLEFSGDRGSNAETFLTRIRTGRAVSRIPDNELLDALPFFLSGIALEWFSLKRPRFRDWEQFEAAWRIRFSDPDFQDALEDEIRERTQGEGEPVADFLTCIGGLMQRLNPPWTMSRQVTIAMRNINPEINLAIRREEVRDLDDLEELATRVERAVKRGRAYRAPRPPERSICPDLAYRDSRPRRRVRGFAEGVAAAGMESPTRDTRARDREAGERPATVPTAASGNQPGQAPAWRCWTCGEIGHLARNCVARPREQSVRRDRDTGATPRFPSRKGPGNERGNA